MSLLSWSGMPVEEIARLAGHPSTRTTEVIYRKELRPGHGPDLRLIRCDTGRRRCRFRVREDSAVARWLVGSLDESLICADGDLP